jgi:hypothetical protein
MAVQRSRTYTDVNAVVGGYLRDLAFAQSSQQKMFGYKRAAAAILALEIPLTDLIGPGGALPRMWDVVFASAAQRGVAIEIDGDPARQDLDHTLASRTLEAGCVIALDSDAHTTTQLSYAETALAHARLAGIPADGIVNCWPLDRLLTWLSNPSAERRQ